MYNKFNVGGKHLLSPRVIIGFHCQFDAAQNHPGRVSNKELSRLGWARLWKSVLIVVLVCFVLLFCRHKSQRKGFIFPCSSQSSMKGSREGIEGDRMEDIASRLNPCLTQLVVPSTTAEWTCPHQASIKRAPHRFVCMSK